MAEPKHTITTPRSPPHQHQHSLTYPSVYPHPYSVYSIVGPHAPWLFRQRYTPKHRQNISQSSTPISTHLPPSPTELLDISPTPSLAGPSAMYVLRYTLPLLKCLDQDIRTHVRVQRLRKRDPAAKATNITLSGRSASERIIRIDQGPSNSHIANRETNHVFCYCNDEHFKKSGRNQH